nr:MAG TPA: hypothetical protein [Caudoviricetes sp.]
MTVLLGINITRMFRKRNKKTTRTKINSEKRTNGIDR